MTYTVVKQKIDELIQQAKEQGALTKEQLQKLHHKFRLEWNYNSNSMEGNTLTVAETRSVMIGNIDVHRKPLKDILEVKGHDEIIQNILKMGQGELRLSEARIKAIHVGIMYEEDPEKRGFIGQWKTVPNEIINHKGEKYAFVAPEEVADNIHELLNRTNAAMDQIQRGAKGAPHPLDIALNFHIDYLNIHPFYDGNGRTARILSNLILVALGYPPFWIAAQERDIYYTYIADIQCYGGRKEELFAFIGELILRSQQMVIAVQAGESIEEADDVDKEIELLKRELKAKEKEGDSVKRSNLIIKDLYDKSLRKFIEDFMSNAMKFSDFYFNTRSYPFIQVEGGLLTDDLVREYIIQLDNSEECVLTEMGCHISYESIKVGSKKDISGRLRIEFQNDKYVIECYSVFEPITKSYDELLTEDEMNHVIKSWSEYMLKIIRENFKKEEENE